MNERIKELRIALNLSQEAFGEKISLTRSGISNIESGLRSVSDRHIKLLVTATGVSEHWLRTGEGEMFTQTDDSIFTAFARDNNLSAAEQAMLRAFISLPQSSRAGVVDFYKALVSDALANYEDLRSELLDAPTAAAARNGDASNIDEAISILDRITRDD